MGLAVRSNGKANMSITLEEKQEDYVGLDLLAFDEGEAERYMSALEETGTTLRIPKEEKKRKLRDHNKRAVETAYGYFRKKTISMTLKRFRDFLLFALAIAVVTALFGLLVYNEAQIASMNFANNKKERQINKMRQETSQLKETLFVSADLESVKETASKRLGMVEPNDKQIVRVIMPKKDYMTTNRSYNSVGLTEEIVAEAKRNLANYYSDEEV